MTKKSAMSVVSRLVFAASSYFVWQERNNRVYSNNTRKEEQVCDVIIEIERLKLSSFPFKNTSNVLRILAAWNLPSVAMWFRLVSLLAVSSVSYILSPSVVSLVVV